MTPPNKQHPGSQKLALLVLPCNPSAEEIASFVRRLEQAAARQAPRAP